MIKNKDRLYLTVLAFQSLLVSFCSPLHPFARNSPGTDSSIFLLIGKYMSQGLVPYRDLFDHKGPLLYVINWAGMLIGFAGVWLIELICMLISVWLCYRCARRFFNESASFWGTFAAFAALLLWFEGGNLTEEYALPLLFGAFYCLLGYFVQDFELTRVQVFVSGTCMGGVLMLRPNIIGFWLGICAVIFFHTLLIKKFQFILRYILFFVLGISVTIAPFLLWLGVKGALHDFYRCYIQFNFFNTSGLSSKISSMRSALSFPAVLAVTVILMILIFSKKWDLNNTRYVLAWTLAASLVTSIVMTAFSGRSFLHYYMVLLPCLVLPTAWVIEAAARQINLKLWQVFIITVLIYYSSSLRAPLDSGRELFRNAMREDTANNTLASIIQEKTDPGEPIAVLTGPGLLYLMSDRPPASYYAYFSEGWPQSYINETVFPAIFQSKPTFVVHAKGNLPIVMTDYLDQNYDIICEYEGAVFYKRISDE